jgi:hypothetical protein
LIFLSLIISSFKLHLFIKGIKRNGLNNTIDVNFLLWINNAYIYVWPCSLHAFDYIKTHMKCLKITKFNCWGYKETNYFFGPFGWFFIFIKLKIYNLKCGSHVHEIIIPKKCEIIYKCYLSIFYISRFEPRFKCTPMYTWDKSSPPHELS